MCTPLEHPRRAWQHATYPTTPLVLLALGVLGPCTDASIFTTTVKMCVYQGDPGQGASCRTASNLYCKTERASIEASKANRTFPIDVGDCDDDGCLDMSIDYGDGTCDDDDFKNIDGSCRVGNYSASGGVTYSVTRECSDNKPAVIGGIVGGIVAIIGRSVLPLPLSWSPHARLPNIIKTAPAPSVPSDATRRDNYVKCASGCHPCDLCFLIAHDFPMRTTALQRSALAFGGSSASGNGTILSCQKWPSRASRRRSRCKVQGAGSQCSISRRRSRRKPRHSKCKGKCSQCSSSSAQAVGSRSLPT